MSARARIAAVAAGLVLLAGCGTGAGADDGALTLQVFAAASLEAPFEEIGEQFEAEHEGVEVGVSVAGSTTLVQQIRQGAPADVLATADTSTMQELVDSGLQGGDPVEFATNTLTIAVPAGNPADVRDLGSLARPGLHLVVCAPAVPCGAATGAVEESAGLELAPVSEEQSVTDVLNKVTSGEADAGLVYVTDVRRAGDAVEGIALPASATAGTRCAITTVRGAEHAALGREFVELVRADAGRAILAGHGFGAP